MVAGYELVGRVGHGSTATVFKAHDVDLGRDVALKQVPLGSPALVKSLRAGAAVLAGLDDEHVVAVFGFFEEGGSAYLVEEWIEGASLSAVLARGGRLTMAQALGVCRGALLGLIATHRRDVVHGDVSPGNILVDTSGTLRLVDFGRGGTPAYRGPELTDRSRPTKASDVHAAATVLVHLLTGEATRPPALARVDAGVREVLERATAFEPTQRYADAAAFLAALDEAATRGYGPSWWTQAGLGALVVPAVATLTGLGTGVAGIPGVGAGAVAAGVVPTAVAETDGLGDGATSASGGAARRPSKPADAATTAGRRAARPVRLLVVPAAAAVLVVGGVTAVALSGGDDAAPDATSSTAPDASPTGASDGAEDATGVEDPAEPGGGDVAVPTTIDVAQLCDGIDEAAVAAALGGPITEREVSKPGDELPALPGGEPRQATSYQCGYRSGTDTTMSGLSPSLVIAALSRPLSELEASEEKTVSEAEPQRCAISEIPGMDPGRGFAATCSPLSVPSGLYSGYETAAFTVGDLTFDCFLSVGAEVPLPIDLSTFTDMCLGQAERIAG